MLNGIRHVSSFSKHSRTVHDSGLQKHLNFSLSFGRAFSQVLLALGKPWFTFALI